MAVFVGHVGVGGGGSVEAVFDYVTTNGGKIASNSGGGIVITTSRPVSQVLGLVIVDGTSKPDILCFPAAPMNIVETPPAQFAILYNGNSDVNYYSYQYAILNENKITFPYFVYSSYMYGYVCYIPA